MQRLESFEPYLQAEEIWSYLGQRFGMDNTRFSGYRLWHFPGRPTIWLAAENLYPEEEDGLETLGLPLLRRPLPRGLPTTAFLQRFGHLAEKNVLQVGREAVTALMQGKSLPWREETDKAGPFIVSSELGILGRGWIKGGRLLLDASKEWRKSLEDKNREQ